MAVGNQNSSKHLENAEIQEKLAGHRGDHEIECCYDSASLWNKQQKCRKNPGHFNFIPVREFGAGHLPIACRDKRIVSYIKKISTFTVKILVKYTSLDRPTGYPCADMRGTDLFRLASGFARLPRDTSEFSCPIADCPYNRKQHNVYGYIRILTSKHVVYDLSEALKTRAQFFYDSDHQFRGNFIVQCVGLEYSLEDNDTAHLQCVTHDRDLCHMLQEHQVEAKSAYASISPDVWQSCHDFCVVIGHPHGMSKTISVGEHIRYDVTLSRSHAHYHTGPTCPGSSGAPVYYLCRKEKGNHPMWIPAIHSFHCLISKNNCAFR